MAAESLDAKGILEVWSRCIGADVAGIDENFFDAGGDSIIAVQIVYELRGRLAADLPLRLLFDNPTVREFAAELTKLSVAPPGR